MSRMQHENVIITAVTAGRGSGGVGVFAVLMAAAITVSQQFSVEINTVLDWVVGGGVVAIVAWFVWMVRDDIPRPGEARRVAAWAAAMEPALEAKFSAAWDEAHAERSQRDREAAALAAGIDAALADELTVPDELAVRRRATREAEAG